MGVSWILQTFYWGSIEPEQGKWDFNFYDTLVNNANNANIKVLGVLAYDNTWIHDDNKFHNYIPPEKIPDFLEYIRRTVEHFKGRVGAWCIWNEPNFSFWKGSIDEYVELVRLTADVIRQTDGEVILIGGAFSRNVFSLPVDYIVKTFEAGIMEKADAIAFHPYELNVKRSQRIFGKFRTMMDIYGYGNKIWITEAGFPTGGWYPTKVSEEKFPETVIKMYVFLIAGGAQKVFWYQLFDPVVRSPRNSEDFFGIVRSEQDYVSKAAQAYRLCAAYLPDSICYTQMPPQDNLPKSLRVFFFKRQDGGALVMWNDGLINKKIRLKLPGTAHFQHDIVSGNAVQIQNEIVIGLDRTPVFITWRNISGNEEMPEISVK